MQDTIQFSASDRVGSVKERPACFTRSCVTYLPKIWAPACNINGRKYLCRASEIRVNSTPALGVTLCTKDHSCSRDFCMTAYANCRWRRTTPSQFLHHLLPAFHILPQPSCLIPHFPYLFVHVVTPGHKLLHHTTEFFSVHWKLCSNMTNIILVGSVNYPRPDPLTMNVSRWCLICSKDPLDTVSSVKTVA